MHHCNSFAKHCLLYTFFSINPFLEGPGLKLSIRGIERQRDFCSRCDMIGQGKDLQNSGAIVTLAGKINTPNPLEDQRLPDQKWPTVFKTVCTCVLLTQEENMVSRWVFNEVKYCTSQKEGKLCLTFLLFLYFLMWISCLFATDYY